MRCVICPDAAVRLVSVTRPDVPPTEFEDEDGERHSHHDAPVVLEWQCVGGHGWVTEHTPFCTVVGCARSTLVGEYAGV